MDEGYDIVSSISPMYYLSIIIGIIGCTMSGSFGDRKFVRPKYLIIYHIFYFILHAVFIAASFYMRLITRGESKFDKRIVLFGIYTSLFISCIVVICHHLFKKGVFKSMNDIYELDNQMTAFGIEINHQKAFKSCFGLTIFLIITAIWYSVVTKESTKLYEFYYWFLFTIQYLITMTMKSQFCMFNVLLKYRFTALDEKLKEVIESTKDNNAGTQKKIIMVRSVTDKEYNNTSILANKIITLSEFHSKLYNISKRINLFYSVQVLLITGKYFVEITATLYYNLRKFYDPEAKPEERYDFYAISHFVWAVLNAIDLLVLVYVCDSMCSAANNSKLTLHKVNLNSKDIEMKKEVTAFSLQLLHNDLILTAAGFFNIDFTLIFNIIGAVTTYLVIFIQFDMSSNTTSTTNGSDVTMNPLYYDYMSPNTTIFSIN